MMPDAQSAERDANLGLARSIFENFAPADPVWQANLADDVVMAFPYAASIGLPPRVEGKEACIGLFCGGEEKLGLTFHDIALQAMADPEWVLVELSGKGSFQGRPYRQQYAIMLQFKGGKLVCYREYFDCKVVTDCFGSIENLMAG